MFRSQEEGAMNVSKQEAQEALEAVQRVSDQLRHAVASGGTPYYLIMWGAILLLGYIGSHFITGLLTGWIWLGLAGTGSVLSFVIGMYFRMKMRTGSFRRILYLWLGIMVWASLIWWIASPSTGEQASLLTVVIFMFGYVVTGLWMEPTATWVGLITTALAVIGYTFFLPFFYLWLAFLGGGTMILSGVYILRRWK
jgi:hypothetical protein